MNFLIRRHFPQLRDAALDALGATLPGRTLQVAAAGGDLATRARQRLGPGGALDVVDIAALRELPDQVYDRAVLFLVLRKLPAEARRRALREVHRAVRPGGRIVVVDYHRPDAPALRTILSWILPRLDPDALDLWRAEIACWLPRFILDREVRKETLHGGLYQRLVISA